MINARHAVTWTSLAVAVGLVACERGLTVATVDASLQRRGPRATLEEHFPCDRHEGTAYPKIASASPEWIALGVRMLQYSDACYTEGILASLGEAMARSPERVLPLVGTTPLLAAERICLPFVSDEIPSSEQRALLTRSRSAIAGVAAPALARQKEACLVHLRGGESPQVIRGLRRRRPPGRDGPPQPA